jgi:hypothetical protein
MPASQFAFPELRKEPLANAAHVRNAISRFDQLQGVSDEQRDEAWRRIEAAAGRYGVELHEAGWRELFARQTDRRAPVGASPTRHDASAAKQQT